MKKVTCFLESLQVLERFVFDNWRSTVLYDDSTSEDF